MRLHVRIDERVAGFTALGIGRETRMPAVVVCTSGTAVANLLPAALEAHHAGVPLLLLTADRPPELRGVGANQTTRQPGHVRAERAATRPTCRCPRRPTPTATASRASCCAQVADEAVAAALGAGLRSPGPVHLNLPFREPLAGDLPAWLGVPAAELTVGRRRRPRRRAGRRAAPRTRHPVPSIRAAAASASPTCPLEPDDDPFVLVRGPRTIVLAGADAGPGRRGRSPTRAAGRSSPRSSAARGSAATSCTATARCSPTRSSAAAIERVVVLGHPTLSREAAALLSDPERRGASRCAGPGEPLNLNGVTTAVDAVAVAPGEPDREWLGAWLQASRAASVDLAPPAPDADGLASAVPEERLGAIAAELAAIRAPLDRAALVDAVWRATWPHDRLVFGSSRLVRVADAVLGGKKVPVHANRGLAGIDGTVATAIGIALASQAGGAAGRHARACSATSRCCTTSARCCCRRASASRASR